MTTISRIVCDSSMEILLPSGEGRFSKEEKVDLVHPMFQSLTRGWDRELKVLEKIPSVPQKIWEFSIPTSSKMALGKAITRYYAHHPMAKKVALLLNTQPFSASKVDLENMRRLCEGLGYDATIAKSCDIQAESQNFLRHLPSKVDSCIVYLSTYAKRGEFFASDGSSTYQKDFFRSIINEKALAGIPKLFIVQACREGASFSFCSFRKSAKLAAIKERECQAHLNFLQSLPYAEDTCVLYSITPGYYTWSKEENHGSWFVQTICKTFAKYAHLPSGDLENLIAVSHKKLGKIFANQSCLTGMNSKMMRISKIFHLHYGPEEIKKVRFSNLPKISRMGRLRDFTCMERY